MQRFILKGDERSGCQRSEDLKATVTHAAVSPLTRLPDKTSLSSVPSEVL